MAGVLLIGTLAPEIDSFFSNYELLRYVGEREQIWKEFVNPAHRLIGGVFSDVASLIKSLTGLDLAGGKTAQEIFAILEDQEKRKVLAAKLRNLQVKLQNKQRVYNCLDAKNGTALLDNMPPADSLVCVEACLASRSAIVEFYPEGKVQLGEPEAWFLIDGSPNLIHKDNSLITGRFLILDTEPGFDALFVNQPPFLADMGWYPSVRITGYIRTASPQTRNLPALSPALIEYKSPKGYLEFSRHLASQLQRDLATPLFQSKDRTEALTAKTWLAPLIYATHKQTPTSVPAELRPLLKQLSAEVRSEMSARKAIVDFYDAL